MKVRVLLPLLAVAAGLSASAADAEKKPLPSDLAAVSAKATVTISFRPADIRGGATGKAVRAKLGPDAAAAEAAVADLLGAAPETVERATFFTDDIAGNFVRVVRLKAKPDADALARRVVPGGKEMKTSGKTYLANEQRQALAWIDETTFVAGGPGGVRDYLEAGPGGGAGKLSGALVMAMGKDAVTVAVADAKVAELADNLPGPLAPLAALLKHEIMTARVELGETVTVRLGGTFAGIKEAKAAAKSADAGRNMLATLVDSVAAPFESRKDKTSMAFTSVLGEAVKSLKAANIETTANGLNVSATMKVEASALGTVAVDGGRTMREAASRMRSQNNLKQIALAMHSYAETYGSFPASATYDKDGKPLLSWRVQLLPFLEQQDLYDAFKHDEPWDSAHNKKLVAKMPAIFAAPVGEYKAGETPYQGYVGQGSLFTGKKGSKFADITDGTSNTLMLVDSAPGVPWTKPADLEYDVMKDPKVPSGMFKAGFCAALADGSVRFVSKGVTAKALKAMITRDAGD